MECEYVYVSIVTKAGLISKECEYNAYGGKVRRGSLTICSLRKITTHFLKTKRKKFGYTIDYHLENLLTKRRKLIDNQTSRKHKTKQPQERDKKNTGRSLLMEIR